MDDESAIPPAPIPFHRTRDVLKQAVHRYRDGQWTDIPVDQICIQARTPDGPIELTIEMLAALLAPMIQKQIDAARKEP